MVVIKSIIGVFVIASGSMLPGGLANFIEQGKGGAQDTADISAAKDVFEVLADVKKALEEVKDENYAFQIRECVLTGGACTLGEQCCSGRCEGYWPFRMCELKLARGQECDENNDCQSHYCFENKCSRW